MSVPDFVAESGLAFRPWSSGHSCGDERGVAGRLLAEDFLAFCFLSCVIGYPSPRL